MADKPLIRCAVTRENYFYAGIPLPVGTPISVTQDEYDHSRQLQPPYFEREAGGADGAVKLSDLRVGGLHALHALNGAPADTPAADPEGGGDAASTRAARTAT